MSLSAFWDAFDRCVATDLRERLASMKFDLVGSSGGHHWEAMHRESHCGSIDRRVVAATPDALFEACRDHYANEIHEREFLAAVSEEGVG